MSNLDKSFRINDDVLCMLAFNIVISETASTWREFTAIETLNLLSKACHKSLLRTPAQKAYIRLKELIGFHIIRHSDGAIQKSDLIEDTRNILKKLKAKQELYIIHLKEGKGEIQDESM